MRVGVVVLVAVTGLVLGSAAAGGVERPRLRLTSPAFVSGGTIPDGFTCAAGGASPPLRWRGVPPGAADLALVVEDRDAPGGTFVHWVVWGLGPSLGNLPEEFLPPTVREGTTSAGRIGYVAPCPPRGSRAHHYVFTLSASSIPLDLPAGSSAVELRAAMRGHVLATARLTGRYRR
jgi:Raf kinase inhibitor-like YbhB/YbcL family protein